MKIIRQLTSRNTVESRFRKVEIYDGDKEAVASKSRVSQLPTSLWMEQLKTFPVATMEETRQLGLDLSSSPSLLSISSFRGQSALLKPCLEPLSAVNHSRMCSRVLAMIPAVKTSQTCLVFQSHVMSWKFQQPCNKIKPRTESHR